MTVDSYTGDTPPGTLADAANAWVVNVRETAKLAGYIADTDLVPRHFRGNPAAVTAAMLYGQELGVGRMTSLQCLNPIQGKIGISAELMRSLVVSRGHRVEMVYSDSERCTIRGQRAGTDTWQEVTWTTDDAKRAGLSGEGWRKYPRAMLAARATTELCRFAFADVLHGTVAVEEYDMDAAPPDVSPPGAAPSDPNPQSPAVVVQRQRKGTTGQTPGSTQPSLTPASALPGEVLATPPEAAPMTGPEVSGSGTKSDSADAGSTTPAAPQSGPPGEALTAELPPAEGESENGSAYPVAQSDTPGGPTPSAEDGQDSLLDTSHVWMADRYQLKEYHAKMRSLGVEDRAERLFITRTLAGRDDLDSSNNLTRDETAAILETLRRTNTRAELETLVAAMHDAQV